MKKVCEKCRNEFEASTLIDLLCEKCKKSILKWRIIQLCANTFPGKSAIELDNIIREMSYPRND